MKYTALIFPFFVWIFVGHGDLGLGFDLSIYMGYEMPCINFMLN